MIDLEWLRRLIEMLDESGIDSLEVSRFGTRVKIAKSPPGGAGTPGPSPAGATGGSANHPPLAVPPAEPAAEEESARADGLHAVTSPMVGTFYRAPAPDAPPYVEVGDRVRKGQTLCILEAMKLMNELESEVSGVVREIAVQNAEPVEYGQLLFRIELDGAN
jgi:acetyl-CoA carboxylase biotin carboxyl carrier protein